MSNISISVLTGTQISEYINVIAQLRIDIFKEFPYLYDGNLEYETRYLQKFMNTPKSMIVILKDNDRIVGAMTGLPLKYEDEFIKFPWLDQKKPIEGVYYFSEILIYPQYRGKGFGKQLFDAAEVTARDFKMFNCFTLATVIRADNHPLKPADYKSLNEFWISNGYQKDETLICHIPWKEIDEIEESAKPLVFWVKMILCLNR